MNNQTKKTITKKEFAELSKVMDEHEIIKQYNIEDLSQANIFQKILTYANSTFCLIITKLKSSAKFIIPLILLALIGGGYYGYKKYNEQINWYIEKNKNLENTLKYSQDSQSQAYLLWGNDADEKSLQIKKLKDELQKAKSELYSIVQEDNKANYPFNLEIAKACISKNIIQEYVYKCKTNYGDEIECWNSSNFFQAIIHSCKYDNQVFACTINEEKTKIIKC